MGGAIKVAMGALIIGGLIIFGPMIPGMLARGTKGTFQLANAGAEGFGMFYKRGQKAGIKKVVAGISKPLA